MIVPQELRLGNLVTIDNPDFYKKMKDIPVIVNRINLQRDKDFPGSTASISVTDGKFSYNQFNEFISPIEMTEDWLLKLGFVKCIGRYGEYYKHKENDLLRIWKDLSNKWILGRKRNDTGGLTSFIASVSVVHQLQNLYFALTGEELTIKEQP
ncbi:hypothetical protein [Chryseobacterium sp.]|jgi:hypothetical protein|uniref:hypothetical protein n=1 Tax=Chryseobacterium sp. TaxID=1871047 RepID=UPI00284E1B32|nr:hypothetical protein [Chryseobacterium sp.]MDR3026035.1 hypothetical protein [Chryseobacterium sp.]